MSLIISRILLKLLVIIILFFAPVSPPYSQSVNLFYDDLNRLIRIEYGDGTIIDYSYDEAGNRITEVISPPPVPPGPATLISPSGAITTNLPNYTWNAVPGSTWYYLWVDDSAGTKIQQWYRDSEAGCPSGTGVCSVAPTTPRSYEGTGYVPLGQGSAVRWIQIWNPVGYGPWSQRMDFTGIP